MRVFRASRRRRWLIAAACLAVAAPVAFVVSGVAAGKQAVATATPVVDPSYIYNQLFDMSYNDVYRVSGADGPPTNPSSPWNEPSTVNGWQEFFQHWKSQLTDKTVMGNVAKFATVTDHYFQRLPEQRTNPNYSFNTAYHWKSDDAEVTIPGRDVRGAARAARRASRRHAGHPGDRRRRQQPDQLHERRDRLRRRSA